MKEKGRNASTAVKAISLILGLTGSYFAANMGIMIAALQKNIKKMEQHKSENNFMESFVMQKEEFVLKPDLQNVYITTLSSNVNIKVPKPEKGTMNVELLSVASCVNIVLPFDVRINCKGSNHLDFTGGEKESDKVINLVINDHLTSLTINFDGDL